MHSLHFWFGISIWEQLSISNDEIRIGIFLHDVSDHFRDGFEVFGNDDFVQVESGDVVVQGTMSARDKTRFN